MLDFLTTPHKDINYNFIFYSYLVLALLCGVLFGVEKSLDIEQLRGYYVIFTPFPPLLLWAIWMKSKSSANNISSAEIEKKTN